MKQLIKNLYLTSNCDFKNLVYLLNNKNNDDIQYLFEKSREVRFKHFKNKIYIRGLIEFTNYCKNDCYYCGIRKSNNSATRYRLTKEEIISCCKNGYDLGFRTFVLQGGEDGFYSDNKITDIVKTIKAQFPDCAVTLSIGEKNRESYQKFFDAGADRYLLRHETSNDEHYKKLHPKNLLLKNRLDSLKILKEIGFQTGCGIMVGSPYQTVEDIANDIIFIKNFAPQMIGIGPFIPHKDTPFRDFPAGDMQTVLVIIAILRLMNPNALIPSTTALGTLDKSGRNKGILAGANVIMPNLSPPEVREKYLLYNNKIATGEEAAESLKKLKSSMQEIGYEIVIDRGDYK